MPLFSINMGREEIGKGKSQGTLRRMSATRHRGQCQACGNIKCKAQKSTFRSKAQRSTFRCKAQQSTYQGQGAARRTSGARCISGARCSKVHLRGKAQQGASQGQGATRSISGARHSKAHVRGKVQQGTCQGKVQQGTCQGKVQQGRCQGKTQQGACQGKTQQGTCQGKTQGTCHGQDAMRHMSWARHNEAHVTGKMQRGTQAALNFGSGERSLFFSSRRTHWTWFNMYQRLIFQLYCFFFQVLPRDGALFTIGWTITVVMFFSKTSEHF